MEFVVVFLSGKCSFYLYCIMLSFLNILQAFGAILLFFHATDGMWYDIRFSFSKVGKSHLSNYFLDNCNRFSFVDFSTYLYFCFYTPIVYVTFLRRSLRHPSSSSGNSLFSYRKQRDEHGSGDLPDSYFPRFSGISAYISAASSGLTSPSYDDLFDCSPRAAVTYSDAPLMLSSAETAESTVTTRTGSDEWEAR
ncbi:hypothetical protein TELCIR_14741 [Teladorsagia circumcincta]|uniref:Uncharacterized protein n=1 Tax=Teladorsagia circumcincta TaxID=45464 RepID=A0A2G9U0A6_TELCI|nr:hypothetical protein TELCIR_14741 [Teladorsagia circumcincta]